MSNRKLFIEGPIRLKMASIQLAHQPQHAQVALTVEIDLISLGDFEDLFDENSKHIHQKLNNYIMEKLKEGI